MKAVLNQCPINVIANTRTPPRYIAIVAPARIEWVPPLWQWIHRLTSPTAITLLRKVDLKILLVTCKSQLHTQTADTGVSGVTPG